MPHVSRHTPEKSVSDKISELFMDCVTGKWSEVERRAFFSDLMTPTERIMFSKRLAILYLLTKGYSFGSIQETLRVSPSTVARLWEAIQKGKYRAVIERIQRKVSKDNTFMQQLFSLLPPIHMNTKDYADRMRRLNL